MTQASVLSADMLFATLDPTLRAVDLPHGARVILSDTVGFISDLPTMLIAAFRATLEEVDRSRRDPACARRVARGRRGAIARRRKNPARARHRSAATTPTHKRALIEVWNKIDRLDADERTRLANIAERRPAAERPVLVSAITGEGIDALAAPIEARLAAGRVLIELELDPADGAGVSWLHRHTEVIRKAIDANGRIAMTVRADAGQGEGGAGEVCKWANSEWRIANAERPSFSPTRHSPLAIRCYSCAFASSHSASISASVASCGALPRAASARSIAAKRRSNFWLVCRNSASGSARRCRARLTAANNRSPTSAAAAAVVARRRDRARPRSRRLPRGFCAIPRADRSSRSRLCWPWPAISAPGSGRAAPPARRPARFHCAPI